MVNLNNYRNTNNFIVHSHILYDRTRYLNLGKVKETNFDIESHPSWYSHRPKISMMDISSDGNEYKVMEI